MYIFADENIEKSIVQKLRFDGHNVIHVFEISPGINDLEVLELANKNKSLLITSDKDFGLLVHRNNHSHYGVLLIRLGDMPLNERIELIASTINKHHAELEHTFSVLTKKYLRTRKENLQLHNPA